MEAFRQNAHTFQASPGVCGHLIKLFTGRTRRRGDYFLMPGIGGEAGLQTSYRVGRRFKVFLEPKIRIYGKELLMQDNVQGSDIMMSLNAGTSFSF